MIWESVFFLYFFENKHFFISMQLPKTIFRYLQFKYLHKDKTIGHFAKILNGLFESLGQKENAVEILRVIDNIIFSHSISIQ